MDKRKPVMKFSAGKGVSAALWENEITVNGRTVTVFKASVERRYKEASGEWKSSTSFSRDEVPHAILCLSRAFSAMVDDHGSRNGTDDEAMA